MYAKFGKLAGRMDRERALQPSPKPAVDLNEPPAPVRLTHSEILRRSKGT